MEYENLYGQVQGSNYDCLMFDLDDTLYPLCAGLAAAVSKNIRDYMVEKLGIEESKIAVLGNLLYKNYGTTMAGLRAIGYDFDYDEYHCFVHGRLPYANLKPYPVLRNLLLSLPIHKVIFTNADKVHAVKALSRLGLESIAVLVFYFIFLFFIYILLGFLLLCFIVIESIVPSLSHTTYTSSFFY